MSGLRDVLSRFVRSLAEQEQDNNSPDVRHDLGTVICWLLERSAYTVIERAFKFEGTAQRRSSGFPQRGVDILAIKPDSDGAIRLYRFVLKEGKFGVTEAGQTGERGNLIHDIQLAASARDLRAETAAALGDVKIDKVSVIAVHNGDLDRREVITVVENLKDNIRRNYAVDLEWWDAEVIINKLMEFVDKEGRIASPGDVTFLPPSSRPFVRAVLASVGKTSRLDIGALERYVDTMLPRLDEGRPYTKGLETRLERAGNEAMLFVHMLIAECKVENSDSVLPILEYIERVASRIMYLLAVYSGEDGGDMRKAISSLRGLLTLYVESADKLRLRLEGLRGKARGLAMAWGSERLDYPYRLYRLLGYLCVAHAISSEIKALAGYREPLLSAILDIWDNNAEAVLFPIMDDQVIEIMLVWECWASAGLQEKVEQTALHMIKAFLLRINSDAPLPLLHQRATWPMKDRDIDALVDIHLGGAAAVSALQGTSLILPVIVYAAHKQPEVLAGVPVLRKGISWQFWAVANENNTESYTREIGDIGVTWFVDKFDTLDEFVRIFKNLAAPEPKSPAAKYRLTCVDRIAWKLYRNVPPLGILINKLPS